MMTAPPKVDQKPPIKPHQRVCIECGRTCMRLGETQEIVDNTDTGAAHLETKAYCGLCLPIEYIKKPIKEWLCLTCSTNQAADQVKLDQKWTQFK